MVSKPEDLQPQRPAIHRGRRPVDAGLQGEREGPDPARGHQRGGVVRLIHRRRNVVCDARRADDPGLHLLFDVRFPAHRRQLLGRRRPDGPRLRIGGDRRPDHPDRRGVAARRRPLPAAGLDQPGGGGLRPGLRLRDSPHRRERSVADVRGEPGERLLLHHHLQRALPAAGRAGASRRRESAARDVPLPGGDRQAHQCRADPGLRGLDAGGAAGRRTAGGALGCGRRRVVGDQLE